MFRFCPTCKIPILIYGGMESAEYVCANNHSHPFNELLTALTKPNVKKDK